ncbi:HlyD family secretion protein [Luteimonas aquatica]|uniref:HlyD family secretion protein n=1 Tax=Luteimonas aquatica TaxID=450364 RepID=UPI001F581A2F|nr:HlyD family efflux transporter periplasmic adaptor subunit [Luteimonas aquatica]
MTEDLFRREVLDARKEQWLGTVRLTSSRLGWPMAIVAAAAVLALLLVLAFGSYARKERVQGRLIPADGLPSVAAPAKGVVARVLVREGQPVRRGQDLLELSSDLDAPQLPGGLSAAIGAELERKRTRLQADLADLRQGEGQRAAALRAKIASLSQQRAAAEQRHRLRDAQAASARAMLERVRPLEKQQIVSAVQIQGYENAALEAEASAQASRQEQLDIEQTLAAARAELQVLPLDTGLRRSEIERTLADVSQERARNRVEGGLRLRAPRAGTVAGLGVAAGDAVVQGQRLLTLIPQGSALRAELWVPSRAAGALRVGTRVAMRFHAFPYQRYGQRYGRVVELSGSALPAQEIQARSGIRLDAPAYRAVIALDPGSGALPLRATMTLDADLLLERRRLYQFLLDPLRAGAGAAP